VKRLESNGKIEKNSKGKFISVNDADLEEIRHQMVADGEISCADRAIFLLTAKRVVDLANKKTAAPSSSGFRLQENERTAICEKLSADLGFCLSSSGSESIIFPRDILNVLGSKDDSGIANAYELCSPGLLDDVRHHVIAYLTTRAFPRPLKRDEALRRSEMTVTVKTMLVQYIRLLTAWNNAERERQQDHSNGGGADITIIKSTTDGGRTAIDNVGDEIMDNIGDELLSQPVTNPLIAIASSSGATTTDSAALKRKRPGTSLPNDIDDLVSIVKELQKEKTALQMALATTSNISDLLRRCNEIRSAEVIDILSRRQRFLSFGSERNVEEATCKTFVDSAQPLMIELLHYFPRDDKQHSCRRAHALLYNDIGTIADVCYDTDWGQIIRADRTASPSQMPPLSGLSATNETHEVSETKVPRPGRYDNSSLANINRSVNIRRESLQRSFVKYCTTVSERAQRAVASFRPTRLRRNNSTSSTPQAVSSLRKEIEVGFNDLTKKLSELTLIEDPFVTDGTSRLVAIFYIVLKYYIVSNHFIF
jgi:hypothetical protein